MTAQFGDNSQEGSRGGAAVDWALATGPLSHSAT